MRRLALLATDDRRVRARSQHDDGTATSMTAARGKVVRPLWLIKGLGAGGAEQLLLTQAKRRPRDIEPIVATVRPDRAHLRQAFLDAGIRLCDLAGPHRTTWVTNLWRLLGSESIDLIHVHSPALAPAARLIGAIRRVPVLYTEHNRWGQYHPVTRWANRLTYPLDTRQFAVSEGVRASIDKVLRARVEVLHHGIDLSDQPEAREASRVREELGLSGDEFVVVVIANLREEKAPFTFLEAVECYAAPCPTRFIWAGQGPLEGAFRERIRQMGLESRVSYLGYRSDVAALLSIASVFTLSSDHEGLPVAVMEALAAGLPIVATAVGGLPEVVSKEPRAGLLVPPREPEQLARAWESVARDVELWRTLSAAARRRAPDFDAQRFVDFLADAYRELV